MKRVGLRDVGCHLRQIASQLSGSLSNDPLVVGSTAPVQFHTETDQGAEPTLVLHQVIDGPYLERHRSHIAGSVLNAVQSRLKPSARRQDRKGVSHEESQPRFAAGPIQH